MTTAAEREANHRAKVAAWDKALGIPQGKAKPIAKGIACQQCQAPMKKTSIVKAKWGVQLAAFFLFLLGFFLLFLFPFGTLVGLALMVGCGSMGYRKDKVWKCPNCGYYFNRA